MKRAFLFLSLPLIAGTVVLAVYLSGGRYVSTENAYVRTGIAMISAGSSGHVEKVFVREHQRVKAGELLFTLDMEPFDLAIDKASATFENTRNDIALLKSTYQRQLIRLAAAEEDKTYAQQELERVRKLKASTVSREKVAARRHELNVANNKILAAQADVASALAQLGGDPSQLVDNFPQVRHAQGELSQAELDRRRASVRAGMSGTIAKLELHPGEYVTKGQPVFSLVQDDVIWIEANLKETQLTKLRIGQSAALEIDAYPGQVLHSEVSSIAPASGAEFAILPPQNATGNWVKITQRVPVRLELTETQQVPHLRAGMSVEVTIDTGDKRSLKKLIAAALPL